MKKSNKLLGRKILIGISCIIAIVSFLAYCSLWVLLFRGDYADGTIIEFIAKRHLLSLGVELSTIAVMLVVVFYCPALKEVYEDEQISNSLIVLLILMFIFPVSLFLIFFLTPLFLNENDKKEIIV